MSEQKYPKTINNRIEELELIYSDKVVKPLIEYIDALKKGIEKLENSNRS